MLQGVSLQSDNNDTTFCNIYTRRGEALTNMVLGGLASEDNLLEAMKNADFKEGYSIEKFSDEFSSGKKGAVAFDYGGIEETLSYVPIQGTDWMLTSRFLPVFEIQTTQTYILVVSHIALTVIVFFVFLAMFAVIVVQIKRNAALEVEKEKDNMINALSSDYRSVYYVDLDKDAQKSHAKIAIASSNIVGKGPGNSVERDFLAQAFSDFIFAIVIEELGLLGAAFVVFLYIILLYRCARIASQCENNFPAFLAMGLGLLLVVQAAFNMMVAVGLAPVTGQPLPLISKGGTSTIINCAYIGTILSVSRSAKMKREKELTPNVAGIQ